MSICARIKRLREDHGLSQADLAQLCGVTNQAVSTWEADISLPRMGPMEKMAAFFGVSKSSIIEDAPDNAAVFAVFNQLTPDDQQKAMDYIRLLALARKAGNK